MIDYINERLSDLRQSLQEWTRDMIREWVANLLTSTTIARASESDDDPLHDDADGWSSSDDMTTSNAEGGENSRPRTRRMEPPCFAYVPLEKEPIKTAGIGQNLLGFAVASTRFRPKGLKKTEWAIYNLRAAAQQLVIKGNRDSELTISVGSQLHIKVDQAGKVTIDSKAGQDLVFNGGTLRVARVTDPVTPTTAMGLWMNAVNAAILAIKNGAPVTVPGAAPSPIGLIDAATGGAQRTKA